jgi:hypothetical protein
LTTAKVLNKKGVVTVVGGMQKDSVRNLRQQSWVGATGSINKKAAPEQQFAEKAPHFCPHPEDIKGN